MYCILLFNFSTVTSDHYAIMHNTCFILFKMQLFSKLTYFFVSNESITTLIDAFNDILAQCQYRL